MDARGHALNRGVPPAYIVNEAKLQVIAAMGKLDRPVSAEELLSFWRGKKRWCGSKKRSILDYHLSTLLRTGVAELVSGREPRFRLTEAIDVAGEVLMFRESYRSLAELMYS
jgi:hypothetical protein